MTTFKAIQAGHICSPYVKTLLEAAAQLNISDEELAQAVQRHPNWLHHLPEQVASRDYLALMACGVRHDENFGLRVGRAVRPASYPLVGYTVMSCSNTTQVLDQILRYECLIHDLGRSGVQIDDKLCRVSWTANSHYFADQHHPLYRHVVDSIFSGYFSFVPWLLGQQIPLSSVTFVYDKPADVTAYEELFRCPVYFQQKENSIVASAKLLNIALTSSDQTIFTTLEKQAQKLLEDQRQSHQEDICLRLRDVILEVLPQQNESIEVVAKNLGMSPRTLQRKLRERATSYQQILNELRMELACNYLRYSNLAIREIAFMLGYQEQSSFHHAFKDWTGYTPRSFRHMRPQIEENP